MKLALPTSINAPYIALSYCWEPSSGMIKTTQETEYLWINGIPWHSLPCVLQDAILLTRAFGIRYLLIDALCILQDDLDDWAAESANMARIYSDSFLTIAATAARGPSHGLFTERWTKVGPNIVSCSSVGLTSHAKDRKVFIWHRLHLAHDRFTEEGNVGNHLEDAPLLSRAWAFQERLLPTRALHFHSEELVWECKSGVSCECRELKDELISPNRFGSRVGSGWLKKSLARTLEASVPAQTLGDIWLNIVCAYSQLRLTRESDRLTALWGIANRLEGSTLGQYHAGIWQHDLARGLVFERVRTPHTCPEGTDPEPDSRLASTPLTWSWASVALNDYYAISHIYYGQWIRKASQLLSFGLPTIRLGRQSL